MKNIFVSDYTLKKLAEEGKATLLFREKTAIASCIEAFGADAIELPEIKKLKEDTVIYKTISSIIKSCAVAIPTGFTTEDADNAWACVKGAAHPTLQVVLPVSTVTMEYTYHYKEAKMLSKITELCTYAKSLCQSVEFVCLDASRADSAFLKSAIEAATAAGATAVCLCDDAGILLPQDTADMVAAVKEYCSSPLYVSVSDSFFMAGACALYALNAGADGVKTAVSGKDILKAEKLCQIISAKGEQFGLSTKLLATEIRSDVTALLSKVGKEAPMYTETAAGGICLDDSSTLADTAMAAKALGYTLTDSDNGAVYKAVMAVCEKKSSVGAKELEAIIASSAMQVPSTYHVTSFNCSCNSESASVAHIVLERDGEALSGVATGDGPVDAAFRAIENCVGCHYELDEFQIQAVTEGKDSLGSVLVKLHSRGNLYSGNGISSDIVGASIRAYVNALNKIVYEEAQA